MPELRDLFGERQATNPALALNQPLAFTETFQDDGQAGMDASLINWGERVDFNGAVLVNAVFPDGTATNPGIRFESATNTGFWWNSGALGFTVGGTNRFTIDSTHAETTNPLRLPNGSVASPALTFTNQTGTGYYFTDPGIFTSVSGTKVWEVNKTYSETTKAIRAFDGSTANAAYGFTSNPATGMYLIQGSRLGWTLNNKKYLDLTAGYLEVDGFLRFGGSQLAPNKYIMILDHANTAIRTQTFQDINGVIAVQTAAATAGSVIFAGTSGLLTQDNTNFFWDDSNNQLELGSGTSALPAYSFKNDNDTGIFLAGANSMGLVANGTKLVEVSGTGLQLGTPGTNYVNIESDGDVCFVSGAGLQYGEIYAYDAASAVTITGTGIANKVQITAFSTNGCSNGSVTPDHTNSHVTVGKAGDYEISVNIHADSVAGAGAQFGFAAYLNNGATLLQNIHGHEDFSGGGSETNTVQLGPGCASLSADDTVEVWVWNETNTQNITIEDITLFVKQVGG
jgi:hypothetical protein